MSIFIEDVLVQGKTTNIHIDGNRISYIGPERKAASLTISGKGKVALPTLINGHTHAAMTLFRGYADDMPLQSWLSSKIWPLEAKLTEEDVYWGTKLACVEMIKSGTVLFNDMYWHLAGTARAVEEMGIRAVISAPWIDFFDPQKAKAQQIFVCEQYEKAKTYCARIQFALGPHAIYTVSSQSLQWIYEFAHDKKLPIHIHLAETAQEVNDCLKQHRLRPVAYLKSLGVLDPSVIAAHGVWLEDAELDILQEYGVNLVYNPISNLKLAVGSLFRYPEIRKKQIPVCIGTDGCASNNNLDMLETLKFASLLQKWKYNDPTILPCQEAWELATQESYRIFRLDGGTLAEGKLADIMLVKLDEPQMTPCFNVISNLVYAIHGQVVDTVICDGKLLMQNRTIPGEQEILTKVTAVANNLAQRV